VPGIRVVTDSAADLPKGRADELGIEVVPLTFRFGSDEFVDGRDLTAQQFWQRCDASPTLPETAAPSPGQFEEAFRRLANDGADGIVCVHLSAGLSATGQAAELGAKAIADAVPVRVIDSRSVSLGQGQIAMGAATAAAGGASLDEVSAVVDDLVARTRLYASLDTLDNLKKGGRIGGAKAMVATMLSFKPVIAVNGGHVEEEAKPRTRTRSLNHLIELVRAAGAVEHLAVVHSEAPDLEEFLDRIGEVFPRHDILVGDVGGVIGTHAGRGAIGVTFQVPQ